MPEARRSGRLRTLFGAQIIFNNRTSVIDCAIKNISATGARLVLANRRGEFPTNSSSVFRK